ncbi:MAG: VCBS repeat-containing protein [Planctomycetaceae bacterium]|nr:VCBS repeat-containing protein [Planctomycetaceae bacterium]
MVLGSCVLAGFLLVLLSRSLQEADPIAAAEQFWERDDFFRTLKLAQRALEQEPDSQSGHLFAGLACERLGRYDEAFEHLLRVDDAFDRAALARRACADLCLNRLHCPSLAVEHYQRLLRIDPQAIDAEQQLAYLLGLSGRWREAEPYRLRLIQQHRLEPILLYLLCSRDTLLENVDDLATMHHAAPDSPLLVPGLARKARDDGETASAEQQLRRLLAETPADVSAQVELGKIVAGDNQQFVAWYQHLPESVRASAGIWSLLGQWAADQSQLEAAARCYWEELNADPNDAQANYQLGRLLADLHRDRDAAPFLQRAEQLEQYFQLVTQAWTGNDLEAVEKAAKSARDLGLIWEAYGWAILMSRYYSNAPWAERMLTELAPIVRDLPLIRTVAESNPARHLNLSEYPLPIMPADQTAPSPASKLAEKPSPVAAIRFENQAASAGIEFSYFNGAPRDRQTRRMYEFNGGGVGVIDYDQDGRPDLFLAQGSEWPQETGSSSHSDRLFRNKEGKRFHDVTPSARVMDGQFSAGIAVGDLDNDGFPDIYVANVGGNRLLMNNGDGTFRDETGATGTAGDDWSTSCAIADINADGLPDLYVVNYLSGPDVFERLCRDEDDRLRSCSPREFPAAQDRLYLNLGDGTFLDATSATGINVPDGKGLGIVIADFSSSGRLDLFIANDAEPNFYFANLGGTTPGTIRFEEQALPRGVAFNEAGRAEACMGIAVGDANGDAQLDLFVTNFHNETNTFYQQTTGGVFLDATRHARLDAPSLKMLGFGTQFLDPDRDGDLDLFVSNGHLDDLRDTGIPFQMRAQFFSNDGRGRFAEISAERLGDYFTVEQLGRAAAIVDWNGDGLEDLVISHLDTPVALLTNQTPDCGNSVRIHLRGTVSSRDAIGATVTLEVGGKTILRQLTAGDGFQASNQRHLVVGLGAADKVDRLTVRWPSGERSELDSIPVNTELLLIEGRRPHVERASGIPHGRGEEASR